MDPQYPLIPVMNILLAFIVLTPLPWQLHYWNTGICVLSVWLCLFCVTRAVNSIIWKDNVRDVHPALCEFSSRVFDAAFVAVPASSLAIIIRMHNILYSKRVARTISEKRRDVAADLILAVGLPLIIVGLHHIVQMRRYDIVEELGCSSNIINTPLSYFLVFMWPLVLSLISLYYCVRILLKIFRHAREMNAFLAAGSTVTRNGLYRATALVVFNIVVNVPVGIFTIYFVATTSPVVPWPGWKAVHANYDFVALIPSFLWRQAKWFRLLCAYSQWTYVASSGVFFLFFGTSRETFSYYKAAFDAIGLCRCRRRRERIENSRMAFASNNVQSTTVQLSTLMGFSQRSYNIEDDCRLSEDLESQNTSSNEIALKKPIGASYNELDSPLTTPKQQCLDLRDSSHDVAAIGIAL